MTTTPRLTRAQLSDLDPCDPEITALMEIAERAILEFPNGWVHHDEADGPAEIGHADEDGEVRSIGRFWGGCMEWIAASGHVVAFDPPTVLAILTRLVAAEGERDEARNLLTDQSRRIDAWQAQASENDTRAEKAEARVAVFEGALESIAANTCCDTCREAALVARHALASASGEGS